MSILWQEHEIASTSVGVLSSETTLVGDKDLEN